MNNISSNVTKQARICTSILELHDHFVVKPKQSFAEPIEIFVFHWHFVAFLMTFAQLGRNRF